MGYTVAGLNEGQGHVVVHMYPAASSAPAASIALMSGRTAAALVPRTGRVPVAQKSVRPYFVRPKGSEEETYLLRLQKQFRK
jgi:hypothetical protein